MSNSVDFERNTKTVISAVVFLSLWFFALALLVKWVFFG